MNYLNKIYNIWSLGVANILRRHGARKKMCLKVLSSSDKSKNVFLYWTGCRIVQCVQFLICQMMCISKKRRRLLVVPTLLLAWAQQFSERFLIFFFYYIEFPNFDYVQTHSCIEDIRLTNRILKSCQFPNSIILVSFSELISGIIGFRNISPSL